MKGRRLVWELLGAAVGAGLASGREIAAFFTESGRWSWAGIVLATALLAVLLPSRLPDGWRGRWPDLLWRLQLTLLLIVTGGAMLAGAGEVAALILPVHGAYWLGLCGTLGLGWFLAHCTRSGLAWVSRLLLAGMCVLLAAGFFLPPMRAVHLTQRAPLEALLRGLAYGGFNAALMCPVMAASGPEEPSCRSARWAACLGFGLLLAAGNAVLLRHGALLTEPLPFVKLASGLGGAGYLLCASCLYLAVLSTLTACLRALGRGLLPVGGLLLAAMLGFSGVIDAAYPVLGVLCTAVLAIMRIGSAASNFRNSARKAFHSPRDML